MESVSLTVFTLTFGFLFLTGGFGIWAIRTTNEVEGRRRIGRFVDDMDYLSDGLLTLDMRGRVTGMNPAARALCGDAASGRVSLAELFPGLTTKDRDGLLGRQNPYEVERAFRRDDGVLVGLRFRSQHTGDASLILVSDVTAARTRQAQDLQSSHLQILGRMARGVAHDFNNILCAISGEAALARRSGAELSEVSRALESIVGLSSRGADLADRLAGLSRMDAGGEPAQDVEDHVSRSGDLLRTALDPAWRIEVSSDGKVPPVPLGGSQLEQILLGIGLTATDALDSPGFLRLSLRTGGDDGQASQGPLCVVITISASYGPPQGVHDSQDLAPVPADDTGVVASVIRSLLEDHGGKLEVFPGRDGCYVYRMVLPTFHLAREEVAAGLGLPESVRAALKGCRVLLALPAGHLATDLEDRLKVLGLVGEAVHTLHDLLERVDAEPSPETLIVDRRLLGGEPNPLIQAILKLLPLARLVILSETPTLDRVGFPEEVTFVPTNSPPDSVIEVLAATRNAEPTCVG